MFLIYLPVIFCFVVIHIFYDLRKLNIFVRLLHHVDVHMLNPMFRVTRAKTESDGVFATALA